MYIVLLAACAFAEGAVSLLSGNWVVKIHDPESNNGPFQMSIEVDGEKISGTQSGDKAGVRKAPTYFFSIGVGGSLQSALGMATSGMLRTLQKDYGLTASDAALVLGFALEYDVADLVGEQVSIVAKLPKKMLKKLDKKTL